MKKYIKIFSILILISIFLFEFSYVNAELGNGINNGILDSVTKNDTTVSSKFDNTLNIVFGTIFMVLKVLGVAGIAINGVRYMYANAEAKGKIKQSLIYIIIGTVFIFGADIVVDLISGAWNNSI